MSTESISQLTLCHVPDDGTEPAPGQDGFTHDLRLIEDLFGHPSLQGMVLKGVDGNKTYLNLTFPAGSPQESEIFRRLREAGIEPVRRRAIMPSEVWRSVKVLTTTKVDARRLDACELLYVHSCEADVGMHADTEGETVVAKVDIATMQKPAPIGSLSPLAVVAVSPEFVEAHEAAGLRGATFHPIRWIPRLRVKQPLPAPVRTRWMGSSIEMPPCLTPRVGVHRDLCGVRFHSNEELVRLEGRSVVCCWDDDGELYYTLRFRRSEVAALGEFDVARTYEWVYPIPVGRPNQRWFPQLIVSQRFRAWAGKRRYRIRYGPCELVD